MIDDDCRQACSCHHQISFWICQTEQKYKEIVRLHCCLAGGSTSVLVSVWVKQWDDWTILKPQCALLSLLGAGDADQLSQISVLNHCIEDYGHDGDGDSHCIARDAIFIANSPRLLPYSPDDPPRSDRGHQPQLLDPLSSPGDTRFDPMTQDLTRWHKMAEGRQRWHQGTWEVKQGWQKGGAPHIHTIRRSSLKLSNKNDAIVDGYPFGPFFCILVAYIPNKMISIKILEAVGHLGGLPWRHLCNLCVAMVIFSCHNFKTSPILLYLLDSIRSFTSNQLYSRKGLCQANWRKQMARPLSQASSPS